MAYHFSKSRYCNGVQCPKMLWMKEHFPEEFDDSVMNQAVLQTGNEVGDLAMGLFGDFTEVPFDKENLGAMLTKTQELLDAGTKVVCEASFSYEGCFCSVDILKNCGNNVVELYEVKSSSGVKDVYLDDVSYQYYVLSKLGFTVRKACLVYINTQYVRHGELELDKLFNIKDLTAIAKDRLGEVESKIAELRQYLEQAEEPAMAVGSQCSVPYKCGYFAHCAKGVLKDGERSVFDIHGMEQADKQALFDQGFITFEDLYKAGVLKGKYLQQVEFEVKDMPPHIDAGEIRGFVKKISFPLYFLDFETFNPAVPLYDGSRPYQQIVFQYSLHYMEKEGGELKHKEFLASPGTDPRRQVAEQLCKDIPLNVCTTAYNRAFEKTQIKELAALYPDLSEHLTNIRDRIEDLMVPFQKRWYYTKEMQGSYSIKNVLPALFPDDPSLNYHNLEGVHNGGEASSAFLTMQKMDKDELKKWRGYLLKYCGLDTFAMVKVWEKLQEAAGLRF